MHGTIENLKKLPAIRQGLHGLAKDLYYGKLIQKVALDIPRGQLNEKQKENTLCGGIFENFVNTLDSVCVLFTQH